MGTWDGGIDAEMMMEAWLESMSCDFDELVFMGCWN
jgi:hypothetical protein